MDDADKKEIEQRKAVLHERRAKVLELLRAEPKLHLQEQAAIVYTLAIEPGIRELIPGVVMTSMAQQMQDALASQPSLAICQCPSCMANRAQA